MKALSPYICTEKREQEFGRLADQAGAEVEEYGQSVEGRPLQVARIPCSAAAGTAPRILLCANIHGIEFIGNRIAHGFLEKKINNDVQVEALCQEAELWIAPCLNPDGYARTWEAQGVGKLPLMRQNARGVDLNRNFPLPFGKKPSWIPGTGSHQKGDATYRGEAPLSEPEVSSLVRLLEEKHFHASANLHSFMGTVITPRVLTASDFNAYGDLARALKDGQKQADGLRTGYRRLGSRHFDVFTGEQEDWQHHALQTWAVCIESFPILASMKQNLFPDALFWRFNPKDPGPWVENDIPGICSYFFAALKKERPTLVEGAWGEEG